MFSEVIAGVDGRSGGRDAIALARLLVAPRGHLTLAHVHAPPHRIASAQHAAAPDAPEAAARELLAREREAASVNAEAVSVPAGAPGRGLHELAAHRSADLLVIGSSHRGFFGRVLVGDDTRAALGGAPCAVAVAPAGYAHDQRAIGTIGVGYAGSPEGNAALDLARALARDLGATVRALQVVEIVHTSYMGFGGSALGVALAGMLGDAETEMSGLDGADGEAVLGVAGEELAAFGDRVDLLVVGSRGYGPLRSLVFGSTTRYLARHARCPLLVLARTAANAADPPRPAAGDRGAEAEAAR